MVRIHYCPILFNISDLQRLHYLIYSLIHQVSFDKKAVFGVGFLHQLLHKIQHGISNLQLVF